ncbi:hypothetical protein IHE61_31350 [Streptomyces sp. GKU 257-1]|nr:hypothetical protein [Streptomyces sp. GKU 257-1]
MRDLRHHLLLPVVATVGPGTDNGPSDRRDHRLLCSVHGPTRWSGRGQGGTAHPVWNDAADYQDIFGKDRYFLELMDHGIDIEPRVREDLLRVGKKLGIPPLVTNDSHYTYAHEATAHDALLCIQTGKNLPTPTASSSTAPATT